jgi:DNA-binding MurR/RpiR family transcriptional regulator
MNGGEAVAVNDNIFLKLREIRATMTPAGRMIGDYILENPDDVPHLSVRELALRSDTSDASVMRFCKTLGFRGYRDFVVGVSAAFASVSKQESEYTDIRPGDDLQTIITNVSLSNCKSIQDTMKIIDPGAVFQAVELLRNASHIEFYGIGASGFVCMDAQQKFSRIGKICFALTDGHSQMTSASLLNKSDVAVLISNSGDTVDILDTLDVAKESGASIVAITRYAKSELARRADVVLNISTPEITIRSGAMGSRIAMLDVIDILFAGVASADYKKVKTCLEKTHDIMLRKHKHANGAVIKNKPTVKEK